MDKILYRNYLEEFFKEFGYDKADSDYLTDIYDKIAANDKCSEIFGNAIKTYEENEFCDMWKVIDTTREVAKIIVCHIYTTDLLLYILFSKSLLEKYEKRGYPRDVWHNTVLNLKYNLEECKLIKGIIGTAVVGWFGGFFRMERVALGRLQFEINDFGTEYGGLHKDTKVINFHIPRDGTPISPERCHEAFLMAKEWYRGQATEIDGKNVFHCESWLLYPKAIPLMKEGSNVRKFFELFDIYDYTEDYEYSDMWRLFDTNEKNPSRLPADSSLRRAYISLMKAGIPSGEGKGIFYL